MTPLQCLVAHPLLTKKRGHSRTDRLLQELSDDDEEDTDVSHFVAGDVLRPWMRVFNQ